MSEPTRGPLDTSVVIEHNLLDAGVLPDESAVSAITLAELAAGPHATLTTMWNGRAVKTVSSGLSLRGTPFLLMQMPRVHMRVCLQPQEPPAGRAVRVSQIF